MPLRRSLASLNFRFAPGGDPRAALKRLVAGFSLKNEGVGIGLPLAAALKLSVPGLRAFPALEGGDWKLLLVRGDRLDADAL